MNERDPVITLLKELDDPVDPRPEFAQALRRRLLEELGQPAGVHRVRGPRRAMSRALRRPLLAGAGALAVAVALIATVVVSRPSPASALDVVRQARSEFAHMPPFQATYKVALNPDGANPSGPRLVKKGAFAIVALSYGGPHRLRTQILAKHDFTSDHPPGSYQIYNGRSIGVYDASSHHFFSTTTSGIPPLEFLRWNGAYPDWERVCRGHDSRVLADARIAGRDARHIRCGNFHGDVWELWIDRQTGLLLRITGQVGGDDFFLGGGISTSAKGGIEIQKLRYDPTFPPGTFSAPTGAFDAATALQAALVKLPPFRAVVATYGHPRQSGPLSYVDEVWWEDEHTWRSNTLLAAQRGCCGSNYTGGFTVAAHGTTSSYNAHDKTFYRFASPGGDPAFGLLDYLNDPTYSPARCPIVGQARVDGRETDHRRCARTVAEATAHSKTWATAEYWIDAATGLALRSRVNGHDLVRVRSIEYHPRLPATLFRFAPPAGSRNLYKLEANPYYEAKLAPGKPAPDWHATTLAGGQFQLTDLRGKPALLLLLPDWCTDPACNDLAPLERAFQKSNHRSQVVWVDIEGARRQAGKIVRLNRLTFPVVFAPGAATKAWAIRGYPEWVLLNSVGRVIEARLGRQSLPQLEQLLAKG